MEGKIILTFLALVACATAASVSGIAGINPNQIFAGGQIEFPKIPGINAPLFGHNGLFNVGPSSNSGNGTSSGNGTDSGNSTSRSNYSGTPFGPFTPFLEHIPGLNLLIPNNGRSSMPGFPDMDDLISRIPGLNGNRTGNSSFVVPPFPQLPGLNNGPYIPGLSEALAHARQHLQAALNITADFSTGMRDAIQTALDSDHPADSMRIILDTIAKVYATVAANCPLIIVGSGVFAEGLRLAGEVARAVANVTVGGGIVVG